MTGEYTLREKALAEFVATFGLVFFGAGAVAIDLLTVPDGFAGGQYLAGAGLGHGTVGWVGIALAHFIAIAVGVYVFGKVSGGHINPAVTVGFLALRRISVRDAAVYVVAQLAGGILAGVVFVGIRGQVAVTTGLMGATAPFPEVTALQAVLAEAVITFFLMVGVMAFAVDDRAPDQMAGLGIGLIIAMGILATGNITGASFNPARTLGPYVTDTLFGGPNLWGYAWIYVVGPSVGAIVGGLFYEYAVLNPYESRRAVVEADEQPAD